MKEMFTESKVAIIGGGRVCKAILEIVLDPSFEGDKSCIVGVADIDQGAEGLRYARDNGIYTTDDYGEFLSSEEIDTIVEITGDDYLLTGLRRDLPNHIRLVDHYEAMSLWDFLQIWQKKRDVIGNLSRIFDRSEIIDRDVRKGVLAACDRYTQEISQIIRDRTDHLQSVERILVSRDQTISQIIEGNTIPTFVIDKDHVVTHWNRALEKVTEYGAEKVIGTKDHWKAFYQKKKPCMADLIVDGVDEANIREHFGSISQPSNVIKGAYQTEVFFPRMGEQGKWLFFTAAPIVGLNGEIVGSIETIWDTTAEKEAKHKLEELEALEASILDSIHIAVLVLRERHIIFANGAVETVFGWRPEELVGRSTEVLYQSREDYEGIGAIFYRSLEIHRSHSQEFRCVRKDGRAITCMMRTTRVGKTLKERMIVASYEDITERKEAERELITRERTLAQIIQGSTIPTFVIDKNHRVTHWNRALERTTGYKADEMIGTRNHWKAFYGGEKPILADLIVDQREEESLKKYYGESGRRSRFIDGAYEAELFYPQMGYGGKWLWFTAAPIKGPDGDIIGAIETAWDTTDSKLLQEEREKHIYRLSSLWKITSALSESLELDDILHAAVDGIISNLNIDSVAVFLRGENEQLNVIHSYGYSDTLDGGSGAVGRDSFVNEVARKGETVLFEDVAIDHATFTEYLLAEKVRSAAYIPLQTSGGVSGVIRASSRVSYRFSEEDKNILEIIGNRIAVAIENAMLHHETKMFGQHLEKKVKEKTAALEKSYFVIQKSEEKYRTMFDADPNPIIIADRTTLSILDINATALDCYEFSKEEFLQMSFLELFYQEDHELTKSLKAISTDESMFFAKRIHKKKDGTPFFVNVHIRSVRFMGRESLIATTPDVTENVEQEAQLIQASKMATLGTMASGIAHEINQPLNVIQVCSDYFRKMITRGETIKDEDLFAMAEEIGNNVARAAQTINHMRDFSRQSEVRSDQININDPINDVFKILGQQLRVHKIEVVIELAADLPLIMADHNRLEQVFINLVTNAKDALDEKELQEKREEWTKRLTIRSYETDGTVVVTVSDNGIGILEHNKEKIFEPFFTTKDVGKGTGLGMSISYGIIQDFGGTIEVDSHVDKGTTFTVKFSAVQPAGDSHGR